VEVFKEMPDGQAVQLASLGQGEHQNHPLA